MKNTAYETFQAGPRKGQPKTLTDRVIRFLTEGLKFVERPSKSKYRLFVKGEHQYHVGKAGAVRAGRTVSNSVSLTGSVHANMKLWEYKTGKTETSR